MKAVVVLELDVPDSTTGAEVAQLRSQMQQLIDGEHLHLTTHTTVGEDAEMVLDVFAEPEVGGGRHVARWLGGEQVTVEHSLRCRRAGLHLCPVLGLVIEGLDAGHFDDETGFMVGGLPLEVHMDRGTLLWGEDL